MPSDKQNLMKKRNALLQQIATNHSVVEGHGQVFHLCTIQSVNGTYYVNLPQVIRRCYFLDSDEINLLTELFSWMDENGTVQVEQGLLSLKTGIKLRTVKTKLTGDNDSLKSKGFITVHKKKRNNVYTISKLEFNPYIILSEMAHSYVESHYYKNSLRNMDWEETELDEEAAVSNSNVHNLNPTLNGVLKGERYITIWRHVLAESFQKTVTRKEVYSKYIQSMQDNPVQDYGELQSRFWIELHTELVRLYEKKLAS